MFCSSLCRAFSSSVIAINACGRYHVDLLGLTRTLTVRESKTCNNCRHPAWLLDAPWFKVRYPGSVVMCHLRHQSDQLCLRAWDLVPFLACSPRVASALRPLMIPSRMTLHSVNGWANEHPFNITGRAFVLQAAAVENVDSEAVGRQRHSRERRSFSLCQVE